MPDKYLLVGISRQISFGPFQNAAIIASIIVLCELWKQKLSIRTKNSKKLQNNFRNFQNLDWIQCIPNDNWFILFKDNIHESGLMEPWLKRRVDTINSIGVFGCAKTRRSSTKIQKAEDDKDARPMRDPWHPSDRFGCLIIIIMTTVDPSWSNLRFGRRKKSITAIILRLNSDCCAYTQLHCLCASKNLNSKLFGTKNRTNKMNPVHGIQLDIQLNYPAKLDFRGIDARSKLSS